MGTRLSKASITSGDRKGKTLGLDRTSSKMKNDGEIARAHLVRIDETASNMGKTSLYFTNETFMFKPD